MDLFTILAPSFFFVLGGIISWFLKSRYEKLKEIEEKLRAERRNIYMQILEPYITLFSLSENHKEAKAIKKIMSIDYKKTAFELCLFSSDKVVNSYNNLIKFSYKAEKQGERDDKKMIALFGNFLLEIRKSLGNKNTKLTEVDMLQNVIKDIHNIL